jgi:hypothetical protein
MHLIFFTLELTKLNIAEASIVNNVKLEISTKQFLVPTCPLYRKLHTLHHIPALGPRYAPARPGPARPGPARPGPARPALKSSGRTTRPSPAYYLPAHYLV